jgi:uncharacterized protein YraI
LSTYKTAYNDKITIYLGGYFMNRHFIIMTILAFALLVTPLVWSQDGTPFIEPNDTTPMNPAANITYPMPVYVVRDAVDIRGTVTLPTMSNYFVEFRPLVLDAIPSPEAERPWFPATLPQTQPVMDNILGTWNTFTAPDGIYELRLTINTTTGIPEYIRLSPIRVHNDVPDFLQDELAQQVVTAIPTLAPPASRATLAATPTPLGSGQPQLIALVDANVRTGDSTQYDGVGFLFAGESAQVVGRSSFGTGWYYIQLENGRRGFIAPSVVRTEGNMANLPVIDPPPPPTPIPTNTPVNTPTPVTSANLVISDVEVSPIRPVCNETYILSVIIKNEGTGATSTAGTIAVMDTRTADGTVVESTVGAFPALGAGEEFIGIIPVTVSAFTNEQHTVSIQIDSAGVIPETNEADNAVTVVYELARGAC